MEEVQEDFSVEVDRDHRLHHKLIGASGKTIARIMNHYKVVVNFLWEHGSNKVTITGTKKNAEDVKLRLLLLADDLLNNLLEHEQCTLDSTQCQALMKSNRLFPSILYSGCKEE